MLALSSRSDRCLSEALRLHVPHDGTPGPGDLLGLELEFSARSQAGCRVHFGSLIHRLALDGSALDPGDLNAYRCSWGGVITSDGAEAEIATPPVWTRPGFTAELQAWAQAGEAALRRAVPRGIELDGYSAHFSAAMPARLNDRVSRLYAETFAAGLMLLMDRVGSPGLLVRPRPGRTELCGEFIHGQTLPAAAAFVAGTTRACAAAVRRRSARNALPPRLNVRLARAVHRYGWYVDRRAFGTDLHTGSRRVLLPRASGGTISAQSYLELAWAAARQALADDAAPSDLQAAEAMVTGSLPLPAEHGQPGARHGQPGGDIRFAPDASVLPKMTPRLCAHVRPGFTLRPVMATWDFTVFEARGLARRAYVCVPRNSLSGFIEELDAGGLDYAIGAYLATPSRHRVLSAHQQTRRPGLYDQMGPPAGLLAAERDPQTGRHESAERGAKHAFARPGKRNRQERTTPRRAPRFARKAVAIGAGLAVLLSGAGVAASVLRHGHGGLQGEPDGGPTAPAISFQPSALSFPSVSINSSVTKSLTMTNPGHTPVAVKRIRVTGPAGHDFLVPIHDNLGTHRNGQAVQPAAQPLPPCLRPLRAGEPCNIQVIFTPSAPGPRTATLRIYFASRPQPQDIALTGTGIAALPQVTSSPQVTLSPPTLDFGPQDVETASPSRPIMVTASGNAPATLAGIAVRGLDSQDFSPTRACEGATITPHHPCSINIAFTPGDAGLRSATLVLTFTGTSKPATAFLSGTGIAVTPAGCSVAPVTDPATVSFGTVAIGAPSKPVTIAAQNDNTAPCALSEMSSDSKNFPLVQPDAVNPCSDHLVLQPGESCVIAIAFYPTAPGSVSGTLTVALGGPAAKVELSGLGADETPPTTPTNFQFDPYASQCPSALVWDPSTDNVGVVGYNVYKNGKSFTTVTGTTYTDPDEGYTDTYAVSAVDAVGNISAETPSISEPAACG